VIDISHFPLTAQAKAAHASRRIGLGITGLADALAMLGVRYGSDSSLDIADRIMRTISHTAYRASIALAQERGVFPEYRPTEYLAGDFILSLPHDILEAIRQYGIRNSHLTAIAPAGTISLLANNVSSGIEPIYAFQMNRKVRNVDGSIQTMPVNDYAWSLFCERYGADIPLPEYFVQAYDIDPMAQLKMQSRLQAHVDQSISKTINIPTESGFEQYRDVFMEAYRLGLKGCTVFRTKPGHAPVLAPSG
jgi:ribonucleoside-diphosphate reductase alpha chain